MLQQLNDLAQSIRPWIVMVDFNFLAEVDECTGHVVYIYKRQFF